MNLYVYGHRNTLARGGFTMKEPDYTMILLSTFGALTEVEIGGGTARTYKDSTTGNVTKKMF